MCGNPIIALIIVDYCMDYCFSLSLFLLLKWIILIIAFGLYGLFVPDNFKTAFPPSSLHGISSHFDDS